MDTNRDEQATDSPQPLSHWPSPRIVYSRHYNIGFLGIDRPITRAELLHLHTPAYLERLRDPKFVAKLLEVPTLRFLPGRVVDWLVLRPMRWAAMGTVIAAREAVEHGLAVNLAGGYHHASPDHGHGFSAYADVGLAVTDLRRSGLLGAADKVVYVDLDAHQGNGVCRTFADDRRVFIYDQYNLHIFPQDVEAQRRIDCNVTVPFGRGDAEYLAALRGRLPPFLDSIVRGGDVRLAIYNAGTDIVAGDPLGGLNVSPTGVLERDRFVLAELLERRIPTLVLLSGGYTRESYKLVAAMVGHVLETWGRGASR